MNVKFKSIFEPKNTIKTDNARTCDDQVFIVYVFLSDSTKKKPFVPLCVVVVVNKYGIFNVDVCDISVRVLIFFF